jgi:hypothetical protein
MPRTPFWLLSLLFALPALAQSPDWTRRYDMSELPDADQSWQRIGEGYALLLDGGRLAVNDNSNAERIAFQTLVGEIAAGNEVHVRASLLILSNLMGQAATLELARPGLEIVLRLHPQQVVLGERDHSGEFRWLGQVPVDLGSLRELELVKLAAAAAATEEVQLWLDGQLALRVTPHAVGGLGVGRVLFGSLSLPDMGASIWDWLEIDLYDAAPQVSTRRDSFGALKARFRD